MVKYVDLKSIEETFNNVYDFEILKHKTGQRLKELVQNYPNNFLKDEQGSLPKGLNYSDLSIRYKCVNIFINNFDREVPFFRICFDLVHPMTGIQIFYYDVDYNIDGKFSDEYFGRY